MQHSRFTAKWLTRAAAVQLKLRECLVRYRRILFVLALLLFAFGLWLSIVEIKIDARDLAACPLAVNLLVLTPLAFFLSAWGLQLTARTIGRSIGFADSVSTSAFGTVADLLPVPGGLMARSAALASTGAPPLEIMQVLSINALLWFGLLALMAAAGFAAGNALAAPLIFTAIGLPAVAASVAALFRRVTPRLLLTVLWHRALSLAINLLRMVAGFATLHAPLGVDDAMALTAANALGSFSTAIPSGIGVGEALAALAAVAVALAPAMAFAVAALNRIIYLTIAGGCAVLAAATAWKRNEQT